MECWHSKTIQFQVANHEEFPFNAMSNLNKYSILFNLLSMNG